MLELSYISKVVGIKSVLNNINLQIPEGQRVALCGDMTAASWLLRVIPGGVQVKRGEVLYQEKPAKKMVQHFSYMGFEGSLLWEKSVAYSVKVRKHWYPERDEMLYQKRGNAFAAEAPSKTCYKKLDRRSQAGEVLAFGTSLGCSVWLIDQLLPACEAKAREALYEAMQEHCKKGGIALVNLPDEMLCGEAADAFDRLIYLKDGSVVADVNLAEKGNKALEVRMKEWKGR